MGEMLKNGRAAGYRRRPGEELYYIDSVANVAAPGEKPRFEVRALEVAWGDPLSDLPESPRNILLYPNRVNRLGHPDYDECPTEGHWVWMPRERQTAEEEGVEKMTFTRDEDIRRLVTLDVRAYLDRCSGEPLAPTSRGVSTGELQVAFLNVGQGDSTLVTFENGDRWLFDANNAATGDVMSGLGELGVERLEKVILTHPHEDHARGFKDVFASLKVDELIVADNLKQEWPGYKVFQWAEENRVPTIRAHSGLSGQIENAKWAVFHTQTWTKADRNEMSLAFGIQFADLFLLLPGDLPDSARAIAVWDQLLGHFDESQVRGVVYKVSHHASVTAPHYKAIAYGGSERSRLSVVSCQEPNRHGLPDKEPMKVLAAGSVCRTDYRGGGHVVVSLAPGGCRIERCPAGAGANACGLGWCMGDGGVSRACPHDGKACGLGCWGDGRCAPAPPRIQATPFPSR